MRLDSATYIPYQLPLKKTWIDSHGSFDQRRGWIIVLQCDGLTGRGECAPLPSAGTERYSSAENWLRRYFDSFKETETEQLLPWLDQSDDIPPAVRCGIESAVIDLLSKLNGKSFCQWLNPAALTRVKVNANLGRLDAGTHTRLDQARQYDVIKLKLGTAPIEQELEWLQALCPKLAADTRLRLDANQAWRFDEAKRLLQAVESLPVESIEEPLHRPDLEGLHRLQGLTKIPLAVDESLATLGTGKLLERGSVRRLTLKPMALGGARRCLQLAERAYAHGLDVVVTTTLESAIGVNISIHLAASLGAAAKETAHGLATSSWLADDLGIPPTIQEGHITI